MIKKLNINVNDDTILQVECRGKDYTASYLHPYTEQHYCYGFQADRISEELYQFVNSLRSFLALETMFRTEFAWIKIEIRPTNWLVRFSLDNVSFNIRYNTFFKCYTLNRVLADRPFGLWVSKAEEEFTSRDLDPIRDKLKNLIGKL